ncbi:hypothetical protein GCM10025774_15680 [Microbacterium kyungheense]
MIPAHPVVVITGASSGIGRATARLYTGRGASLVLASRSRDALETVAEECRRRGAPVLVVPTDVTRETEVHALAEAAVAEFDRRPSRRTSRAIGGCSGLQSRSSRSFAARGSA